MYKLTQDKIHHISENGSNNKHGMKIGKFKIYFIILHFAKHNRFDYRDFNSPVFCNNWHHFCK